MEFVPCISLLESKDDVIKTLRLFAEYIKVIEIMQISEKYVNKDGKECFVYNNKEFVCEIISKDAIKLASFYNIHFNQKYFPELVIHNNMFYLGSFNDDYYESEYRSKDFFTNMGYYQSELFTIKDGKQTIEVCENGLICRDLELDINMYFSLADLDGFLKNEYFNTDISKNARQDITEWIDGFKDNMLHENSRVASTRQKGLNKYCRGYSSHLSKDHKHDVFTVNMCYKGRLYKGKKCETEIEAACERFRLETELVHEDDWKYLFNIKNNHLNQRWELESYIRGEITQLGLLRKTLVMVARNPYLVIRYNLSHLCRSMCINIQSFMVDDRGYIVNHYGVSYSKLADFYARGLLTGEEIFKQYALKSLEDLNNYKVYVEQDDSDE